MVLDCEKRVDAERERVFAAIDTKGVGYLEQAEFRDILKKLHVNERDLTDDEIAHGWELFGGKRRKLLEKFRRVVPIQPAPYPLVERGATKRARRRSEEARRLRGP